MNKILLGITLAILLQGCSSDDESVYIDPYEYSDPFAFDEFGNDDKDDFGIIFTPSTGPRTIENITPNITPGTVPLGDYGEVILSCGTIHTDPVVVQYTMNLQYVCEINYRAKQDIRYDDYDPSIDDFLEYKVTVHASRINGVLHSNTTRITLPSGTFAVNIKLSVEELYNGSYQYIYGQQSRKQFSVIGGTLTEIQL